MQISQNLVIHTFFQYCKRPVYKKAAQTYNAECPYCREGDSAGKKRRFFYLPREDLAYCHNCSESKSGIEFVKNMTGMSTKELLDASEEHVETVEDIIKRTEVYKKYNPKSLPDDSINLFDKNQISFYKDNEVIKLALDFITRRRIDTATYRPKTLWMSLSDFTHKNRIIFPFYSPDSNAKIEFYQSRALYKADEESYGKYLSKSNSDKGVFNINCIDPNFEYIFPQEGPIDSMFLKNSVALAGKKPTEEQEARLKTLFPFHQVVHVLDNQWCDKTSYEITNQLLEEGKSVFIWPEQIKTEKDINDLCVTLKRDEINPQFILDHTYSGMKGLLQFAQVKLN